MVVVAADARLARLVHGAAVFGADVDELVRLARGDVGVLTLAAALADGPDPTPGGPAPAVVVAQLRRAVDRAAGRGGSIAQGAAP